MKMTKVIQVDLVIISILMVLSGILIYAFPGSDIFTFVLAALILFFIPGYLFNVLIFSDKNRISRSEVLLSSLGMSVVLNGVVFLLVTYTVGLDVEIIFWTIATVVGLLLIMVLFRRSNVDRDQWSGFVFEFGDSKIFPFEKVSTMVVLNTTVLLIVLGMFVWLFLIGETTQPEFTEFYVLDSNNEIFNYSIEAIDNDPFYLHYEIINQEGEDATYGVVVYAAGNIVGADVPILVANGEIARGDLEILIRNRGQDQKLELKLLREGFSDPIRELHVWVDVAPDIGD